MGDSQLQKRGLRTLVKQKVTEIERTYYFLNNDNNYNELFFQMSKTRIRLHIEY